MLVERIVATLKFFDLQDYPLTLLELQQFLISSPANLKNQIDHNWELLKSDSFNTELVPIDQILACLNSDCHHTVVERNGFYCLAGRTQIIDMRLANYSFGILREQKIKKYLSGLMHLPFIRGVALGGSQAMGLNKKTSDIDLLIITESNFLWLARTFVTIYFQILGQRRHGKKIANRFCLNHYLAKPKPVERERNLYKAMEYARLRPVVYGKTIANFQQQNYSWIKIFFPNWQINTEPAVNQSGLQKKFEALLNNSFGRFLEQKLQTWQIARIKQGDFIFVTADELSFHPESKHKTLLQRFFASV